MQNIIKKVKTILHSQHANIEEAKISNNFPADFSKAEIDAINQVSNFTMTSIERLVSLYRAVEYIEVNKVEGDIVECGVWRGGSMMIVANYLKAHNNQTRNLFLFDTYEGMSEPSENDVQFDKQSAESLLKTVEKSIEDGNNLWCYASLEDVKHNILQTQYDASKINLIKGKVEDTLPTDKISKIALLRLDTDWYESTKHELEHLYDKLVKGGVLIIDDYGHWDGARKAVDEFIEKRKLKIFLSRIDYTGRLAIKLD